MTTFTNERATMVQNYDLDNALAVLRNGGLILYPTDTVWSIGCDATNPLAAARIRQLKRTDDAFGLEVLVNSLEMLRAYVGRLHPRIETLLLYHVRPLTVLYDQARNLPDSLLAIDGSISIRLVQDNYCSELIGTLGKPLVAAPADLRNDYFPVNFGAISSDVIERVDYVSRYRRSDKAPAQPSVMVKLSVKDELEFLRE
ncbi:MAG: Sua5/YciO/YrdC/YwlC family protein [Phaeodactylibacter sp.]|nr:Sua5/YciO/YrdC/YwlC family protein [Phaeodactylibacter sp.]MCB9302738.1 Sua5/YciO/YrdC/YwlC family protein [Lewinellaceae bacterium]HQU60672.1 Sua5/YciO/YrdC/YwlC family protein [Saprospiraceae bacterium]